MTIRQQSLNMRKLASLGPGYAWAVMLLLACGAAVAQPSRSDPAVTPGAVNTVVTTDTIAVTICVPGWAHSVRPPARYTSRLKRRQLRALVWSDQRMRDYGEDHLVPLELSGAPGDHRSL